MSITFKTVCSPETGEQILSCYASSSKQASENANQKRELSERIQEVAAFILSILIWPLTFPVGCLTTPLFSIDYLKSILREKNFKQILLKTKPLENSPNLEACRKTCQKFLESKRKELVKDIVWDLRRLSSATHLGFPRPKPISIVHKISIFSKNTDYMDYPPNNLPKEFYTTDFLEISPCNSRNERRDSSTLRHLQANKINIQSIDRQLKMLETTKDQQELREKIRHIAKIQMMGCAIEKESLKESLHVSIMLLVPAGLYIFLCDKFDFKRWVFGEDKSESIAIQYNELMRKTKIEWIPGDLSLTKS